MTFLQFIFYAFSAVAVASGLMVIASSNPVRGALFLVVTFFAMSGIWLILHAEFLALILVLVYVGAVMTLFLFVVMMLSTSRVSLHEGFVRYFPIGVIIILMVVGLIIMMVGPHHFGLTQIAMPPAAAPGFSNTESLGLVLYTDYAYPLEVAGVLLLTAIVAAISLTHRAGKRHKSQQARAQISVRAQDRMRLIKMPSEPKIKPKGSEQ